MSIEVSPLSSSHMSFEFRRKNEWRRTNQIFIKSSPQFYLCFFGCFGSISKRELTFHVSFFISCLSLFLIRQKPVCYVSQQNPQKPFVAWGQSSTRGELIKGGQHACGSGACAFWKMKILRMVFSKINKNFQFSKTFRYLLHFSVFNKNLQYSRKCRKFPRMLL